MITLASDCLLFRMNSGESVPFSPEMVSFELVGETTETFEAEFVQQACHAVFHYFKHELGLQSVAFSDFAGALEKVLHGFALTAKAAARQETGQVLESDLWRLACESGPGWELIFFSRLRQELRDGLRQTPRLLRFRGLRGCVKQLLGARRWSVRCRDLEQQIVEYLRHCLSAEAHERECALVVE